MFLLLCRLLRFLLILSLLLCATGAARASKLGVAQACVSHGGGAWRGGAEERHKEERVEVAGRPSRFLATMPPFTVWRGARAVWRGARTGCRRGCPSPCGKERPRPDDEAACHGLTTRPDDEGISTPPQTRQGGSGRREGAPLGPAGVGGDALLHGALEREAGLDRRRVCCV